MQENIEDFCIYLSSEKGFSRHTLEAYRRDVETLLNFLKKNSVSHWSTVDLQAIVHFLGLKKMRGYASSSICRGIFAIKTFFRFLKREGVICSNPTKLLETSKLWQRIPSILTVEEMELLLSQPDRTTKIGARDAAILEVLYGCGIRVSELCTLKIFDVNDDTLLIHGKGSKERVVPIGSKAIEAIDHYLCHRDNERGDALFVGKNGKKLSRRAVWEIVNNYKLKARISKRISPHTFRHTYATHLLDSGADLRVIQELLGHASIHSTDRYTQISTSLIQKEFNRFHPRQDYTF